MDKLQCEHIKTYVCKGDEYGERFKVHQFYALSNGQFLLETFEVILFPEGWWRDDEACETKRFKDYFSASSYLKSISSNLVESDTYDPVDAVGSIVEESYRQT